MAQHPSLPPVISRGTDYVRVELDARLSKEELVQFEEYPSARAAIEGSSSASNPLTWWDVNS